MAFTGAATIKKISDSLYRITGLSLAAAAAGTIAFAENAAASEVDITAPEIQPYETVGTHGGTVNIAEGIQVDVVVAEAGLAVTEPVSVVKSGTTKADFLITLTNPDAAASGALEIYIRWH